MKQILSIRQFVKRISVTILSLFLFSCYHAKDVVSVNSAPVYTMTASGYSSYNYYYVNSGGNPQDSVITFTVNNGDSMVISFNYLLVSGNPTNYYFSLLVDSLPSGITTSRDSLSFRLPNQSKFVLHVNTVDTGYTFVKFREYNTITGTSVYKFRLHVLPTPPPPDCAQCFAGNWQSENNCGTDSCTTVISIIPGMPHWVTMRNICCLGDSVIVNAYISCDSGIFIPRQTSYGYTISGSTNISDVCSYIFISIPDTVIHNGDTQICVQHIYHL